ncbi:DUF805 domain-containing protein [Pseudomaricurvus sp. HS19]|uniref:DUF805 domain-containing protein n=1 Tax=Pseudomaricurvus sp. HS19 TaxID=2692626 RepID=UPI00136B87F4|nr:DUF805 domain-containing protein [Pseudomaricurvus sp. HS19]MYM64891.1 DUF805 domain-containing protein [Pseudomaricurvus sp. HS19]
MDWYFEVLKKYATFSGRARRKEYWMFYLFNNIMAISLIVIETMLGGPGAIGMLYILGTIIPSLAVAVRRLHDTDRSGWWLLISIVPLIGPLVVFIFTVLDSSPGQNNYGAYPKEVAA